ncbi:DUF2784 domain-containing protein [Blastococcus sp. SYSU DS0617]
MLTGALLAVRWPRLVLLHAPVALAILAVNLAGADCPLTDLELALRERAGRSPTRAASSGTTSSHRSGSTSAPPRRSWGCTGRRSG